MRHRRRRFQHARRQQQRLLELAGYSTKLIARVGRTRLPRPFLELAPGDRVTFKSKDGRFEVVDVKRQTAVTPGFERLYEVAETARGVLKPFPPEYNGVEIIDVPPRDVCDQPGDCTAGESPLPCPVHQREAFERAIKPSTTPPSKPYRGPSASRKQRHLKK